MLWACGEPGSGPGRTTEGPGSPGIGAAHLEDSPGKTTKGGGAGSPEGAGQGSGRVFVGQWELEVGPLRTGSGVGQKRAFQSIVGGDTARWRGTQISLQNLVTRDVQMFLAFCLALSSLC